MSKRLRGWLNYLVGIADGPHAKKAGKLELLEERMNAYAVAARGWAFLAGAEGDDTIEAVETATLQAIESLSPFMRQARGRREGSVSEHTKKLNQAMEAELKRGVSLRKAARKIGGEDQAETHRRRIQRKRKRVKQIIALQTR